MNNLYSLVIFYFHDLKLATLLYIQNSDDQYLLLERSKEPNKGLLSPPGGKLESAESPFGCAVREAKEECGIDSITSDWKMLGIVTEKNYPEIGDIMVFLMAYKKKFEFLPQDFNEGKFRFISKNDIPNSSIPESDKLFIWKFVLNSVQIPFSIFINCNKNPFECVDETAEHKI